MIGSPDLLAFTGTEGFGEGEEDREGLPEELSVPRLPPSNPWTSCARFHRDFILVAEFSEQVGPQPVLTIPDDPGVVGSFDLNHFSVRIMSVDYQASGPCQAPPTSPGPRLNFSEDSKVVLGDSAEDAFAYVQHVTLYDLEARGMVRPFCMAYVCSDQRKLMENFSELSAGFSKASDSLKTGNRQAFSTELRSRLQELEYRRLTLLQETEPPTAPGESPGEEEKEDELDAVERSISHHRDLVRQVTSYPNRKLKHPDFLPYDPADSLADPMASLPPECCPPPSSSSSSSSCCSASCRSERRLKPLEALCHAYFLTLMKEQLVATERRLRGDGSALRTARAARPLTGRSALVNFLFDACGPEDADEEEEEEERESAEAAERQGAAAAGKSGAEAEALRSGPMSLESFFSCVEEISIKLEAGEAGALTPDPDDVAMEMTGSVSSGDSIEVLGTEKSYRTQQVGAGSDGMEAPVAAADACCRRAAADWGARGGRTSARRADSEDSIEVLSTTGSICPDDLTAITEEEDELQPLRSSVEEEEEEEEEEESGAQCRRDGVLKEEKTAAAENEEDEEEAVRRSTVSGEVLVKKGKAAEGMKSNRIDEDHRDVSRLLRVESAPHWSVPPPPRPPPPAAAAEADRWPPPGAPLRLLSVDEASDSASVAGSSDRPPLARGGAHRRRRRRKAGLRALRFLKHNSFSQHAVFCLLSGRPLVVVGGDGGLVRKLVEALSLFLPAAGPDGAAVMLRLTAPLQLSDLLTWRLMGIHRCSSGSSAAVVHSLTRYSRYLALLDLDQRTLRCPPYRGSLVGRLADPRTGIGRGLTYLLHLEGGLTALAQQALLLTFSPAGRRPRGGGGGGVGAEGKDATTTTTTSTTRAPCSSEQDLRVMHFLCDLIRRRHAGRGPPVLRISYNSMQLHRNTYAA